MIPNLPSASGEKSLLLFLELGALHPDLKK